MDDGQVLVLFSGFRRQLDDHHDRKERVIKTSREATSLSKKVIFLLHRILNHDSADATPDTLRAAREKLQGIQALFACIKDDLQGEHFWRYQKQISPGLQEYIEALGFAHYLEHNSLISLHEAQRSLCDKDGIPFFPLPVSDFVLGLSDITGELMRLAISGIARRGGRRKAIDVCSFVRQCKSDFEQLAPYNRELSKKLVVTAQSLEKIEDAVYATVVRGSEYDLPPDMLDDIVAQSLSAHFISGSRSKAWVEEGIGDFREATIHA